MPYIGLPNNGEQTDNNDDVLLYIAKKYEDGIVTDNNISNINWLSGLEQAICFQYNLDPFIGLDIDKIYAIKKQIIYKVNPSILKEGYYTEVDNTLDRSKLRLGLYEKGDEVVHREFVEDYYGYEQYNAWTDKLAMAIIEGVLTEDNPSYLGFTGLDQAIILGCNLEPINDDRDLTILKIIKQNVKSRVKCYQGGNGLNTAKENIFKTIELWSSK